MVLRTSDGHWRPDFCWTTNSDSFHVHSRIFQSPKLFGTELGRHGPTIHNTHKVKSPKSHAGPRWPYASLAPKSNLYTWAVWNPRWIDDVLVGGWLGWSRLTHVDSISRSSKHPKIKQDIMMICYWNFLRYGFCWRHEALRHWRWYSIPLALTLVVNHGKVKITIHWTSQHLKRQKQSRFRAWTLGAVIFSRLDWVEGNKKIDSSSAKLLAASIGPGFEKKIEAQPRQASKIFWPMKGCSFPIFRIAV